jgi:hypothetical protein
MNGRNFQGTNERSSGKIKEWKWASIKMEMPLFMF